MRRLGLQDTTYRGEFLCEQSNGFLGAQAFQREFCSKIFIPFCWLWYTSLTNIFSDTIFVPSIRLTLTIPSFLECLVCVQCLVQIRSCGGHAHPRCRHLAGSQLTVVTIPELPTASHKENPPPPTVSLLLMARRYGHGKAQSLGLTLGQQQLRSAKVSLTAILNTVLASSLPSRFIFSPPPPITLNTGNASQTGHSV